MGFRRKKKLKKKRIEKWKNGKIEEDRNNRSWAQSSGAEESNMADTGG